MGFFRNLKNWLVIINENPRNYVNNYLWERHHDYSKKIDSLRDEFNNFRDQHYSNNKRIFDEINNLTNAYSDTKWNTIVEPKLKRLEDMPDSLSFIYKDLQIHEGRIESLVQINNEQRHLFDLEIKRLRKRIIALEAKNKNKEPKVTNNPGS